MRLFLSSWHLGDEPHRLTALVDESRPVAVIANALDALPADLRRTGVEQELTDLADLGLEAHELDLRHHFAGPERLAAELPRYGTVWLRGGNVFVLRYALARSGADVILTRLVREGALTYGGYSAGACVLASDLHGLELVDDHRDVRKTYAAEPVWEGLGLVDFAIVPHYRSGHPESPEIEQVAARYRAEGVPHRTLRDGEIIVIDA